MLRLAPGVVRIGCGGQADRSDASACCLLHTSGHCSCSLQCPSSPTPPSNQPSFALPILCCSEATRTFWFNPSTLESEIECVQRAAHLHCGRTCTVALTAPAVEGPPMRSCEIHYLPEVPWLPFWSFTIHCLVPTRCRYALVGAVLGLAIYNGECCWLQLNRGWHERPEVLGNAGGWRRLLPGLGWLAGALFPVALRKPNLHCTARHHWSLQARCWMCTSPWLSTRSCWATRPLSKT